MFVKPVIYVGILMKIPTSAVILRKNIAVCGVPKYVNCFFVLVKCLCAIDNY